MNQYIPTKWEFIAQYCDAHDAYELAATARNIDEILLRIYETSHTTYWKTDYVIHAEKWQHVPPLSFLEEVIKKATYCVACQLEDAYCNTCQFAAEAKGWCSAYDSLFGDFIARFREFF